MRWFWRLLIVPLLDALRPARIIEIGSEDGVVTVPLVGWASSHGAVVHSIDPMPKFDVAALQSAHRDSFRFHQNRSLKVLPRLNPADLVLIDGDHNWYTVLRELRQLERRAARARRQAPLILVHDVEWPYARRDLYYAPETIPAAHRHPHSRTGIVPGRAELGEPGLNPHLQNALVEGGPGNGVLTAIEDFLAETNVKWEFTTIPGLFGLGILAPRALLGRRRKVRAVIESTSSAEFLTAQCHAIEAARNAATIRYTELSAKSSYTRSRSRRSASQVSRRA